MNTTPRLLRESDGPDFPHPMGRKIEQPHTVITDKNPLKEIKTTEVDELDTFICNQGLSSNPFNIDKIQFTGKRVKELLTTFASQFKQDVKSAPSPDWNKVFDENYDIKISQAASADSLEIKAISKKNFLQITEQYFK